MAVELRALLLLFCFPGLQAQTTNAEERRQEGSVLYLQCPYIAEIINYYQIVWCRVKEGRCDTIVSTSSPQRVEATGRTTTLSDDPVQRTLSVTMTKLRAEDSGTYSCAYSVDRVYRLKTISLNVFKEVLRWELDSLAVQCPYSSRAVAAGQKVWCRWEGQSKCTILEKTHHYSTWSQDRAVQTRIEIEDYSQRALTVTIKKLQAWDTGVYWCAHYRDSGLSRITEVVLSVAKRTQQHTAKESGNFSVQCLYRAEDYKAVSKAWCKVGARKECHILATTSSQSPGHSRVRIQDDTVQGILTITMEKVQAQDSGVYWCALHEPPELYRMEEVTLQVAKVLGRTASSEPEGTSQATPLDDSPAEPSSSMDTFLLLSVVLGILLALALITSTALCVRQCRQKDRTGKREADDTYEQPEATAEPDSTGRKESLNDDSGGLKGINLDLQSCSSPEDPLYSNIEPSQALRKPQNKSVEYAVIAFKQFPRSDMN
ncbi:PREDICTED: polymeric immunoglobulin receptor-like [Acanthisitta chloris]|uniref:polymeric immunoglobulin receptor-like n=1 Tax=Acanthisitta chloris TaxID=57068 RepID=UPI0004F0D425|nr:PREDICTED: polymeric immunoglobulin receptor-like [Acanthisitta chloris]